MIKKFQPSNGTHGEIFMNAFCYACVKWPHSSDAENQCRIALRTMAYSVKDKEYPEEWQYTDDGPVCTAYKSREEFNTERRDKRKNLIKYQENGTLSLF